MVEYRVADGWTVGPPSYDEVGHTSIIHHEK